MAARLCRSPSAPPSVPFLPPYASPLCTRKTRPPPGTALWFPCLRRIPRDSLSPPIASQQEEQEREKPKLPTWSGGFPSLEEANLLKKASNAELRSLKSIKPLPALWSIGSFDEVKGAGTAAHVEVSQLSIPLSLGLLLIAPYGPSFFAPPPLPALIFPSPCTPLLLQAWWTSMWTSRRTCSPSLRNASAGAPLGTSTRGRSRGSLRPSSCSPATTRYGDPDSSSPEAGGRSAELYVQWCCCFCFLVLWEPVGGGGGGGWRDLRLRLLSPAAACCRETRRSS